MPTAKDRTKLIQEIQRIRGSRLICYLTSDRENLSASMMGAMQQDVIRHIYELLRGTWKKSSKRLDLFIYTRGGDSDVPWALMSMLREVVGKKQINVLIPYRCHSAGTITALGADEIVMGPKGELGPIDATTNSVYNPPNPKTGEPLPVSVEDVLGYFSLLERVGCTGSDSKIQGLRELTNKVHPYALGIVQRVEDQTKLVAGQLLASRINPFSEAENEAVVSTLAKRINSHRHAISRSEAVRQVGLTNVKKSEEEGLEPSLWKLYLAFEDYLQLATPFSPEDDFMKDQSLDSKEYAGLPCACIETESDARVCRFDVKMTRVREPFQTLTVQPQVTVPPPVLPAGIDPAQIQQMIQDWYANVAPKILQKAIADAVEAAMKAAPFKGFQRIELRRRWMTDSVPKPSKKIKHKNLPNPV